MTLQGDERYDILFPKYKKGGHIVRKVTVNPTYSKSSLFLVTGWPAISLINLNIRFIVNSYTGYIDDLKHETIRRCKEVIIETLPQDTPAPLSTQYERPDKLTAIKSHKSRFSL